ncbi:class I mannose-6-phosphate isomerase [Sphingomonas sp. ASV193]|uniref:class I mannose-6-phosphate isomerase n=1 Tax=Sphingomonas sp. ASV193 TaxID=3144405 RepID=UPI0032E8D8A5
MITLETKIVEKPWGRTGLPARFGVESKEKIGEIWFVPPAGRELDVMAKYLFTSERLSIQVHPDDETARARGYPRGKDECWLVLDSHVDAELGIGTVRPVAADELIEAAKDGTIVDLIDWKRPKAGDFIYNPAETVHALGPGLTVLEVQQAVDLTYRLFDYGRPRELHLAQSRDVVDAVPHRDPRDGSFGEETRILLDGPKFGLAWCVGEAPALPDDARDIQLLPVDGAAGGVASGACALVDRSEVEAIRSDGRFVLAWSIGG